MERHLVKICEDMLPNLTPESCALFGPRQVGLIVLEQVFQSNSQIAVSASTIAERAIWRSLETQRPTAKASKPKQMREPATEKPTPKRKAKSSSKSKKAK
ncbi:MAG: hypothetical protein Q6361_00145, partial [Candidatus Hermodarchaeota archaeon]|nr:hypothetical protein [Candidatus Hermodarchaeota archaeon]